MPLPEQAGGGPADAPPRPATGSRREVNLLSSGARYLAGEVIED
jgi:hypothetical protein